MRVAFFDPARERSELAGAVERAISEVLDEGRFILGPQVEAFERAWAQACGARFAVGCASGTNALSLALRAVGIGAGDEVLTAANTCVPTVAAIEDAGAVPVLVDVDETSTLDPAGLPAALTGRTRAVVPVHLYGRCADMDAVRAFAGENGLRVIEDAAQAHGAEVGGRRAGTLADAAAFSFYPTKNLGAIGDAGAIVTDDAELAERARLLRDYGQEERFRSVTRGTNSRLDTLQAAVLLAKLPSLAKRTERRRALAARYGDALTGTGLVCPVEEPGRRHVYHLYVAQTQGRDAFRAALAKRGVETLVHYPRPIHRHPAYAGLARPGLERSERDSGRVVSLPLYPELADDEVEHLLDAVRTVASDTVRA